MKVNIRVIELIDDPYRSDAYSWTTPSGYYAVMLLHGPVVFPLAVYNCRYSGVYIWVFHPDLQAMSLSVDHCSGGFICLFKPADASPGVHRALSALAIDANDNNRVIRVNKRHHALIRDVCKRMAKETDSDYVFRDLLIQNYLLQIMHYILKQKGARPDSDHE